MMHSFQKITLFLLSACIVVILFQLNSQHVSMSTAAISPSNKGNKSALEIKYIPTVSYPPQSKSHDDITNIKASLVEISKDIQKGLIHAKSMKTQKALNKAKVGMKRLLKSLGVDYTNVTGRKVESPKNVCPEVYNGTNHGFHLWDTGFVETNCSYKRPINKLVTILMLVEDPRKINITLTKYKGIKIIASALKIIQSQHPSVLFVPRKSNEGKADAWTNLLERVNTEYVLIARDVELLDDNIKPERLIGAIESLKVSVAAGAYRSNDGHWKIGCHQRALRNYKLVYHEGYDESAEECLICDHVTGPFIINTKTLKELGFDNKTGNAGLFEDFFIRLGEEKAVVCPDVMFNVHMPNSSNTWQDWREFAKKWKVTKISITDREIDIPCDKKVHCSQYKSIWMPPCCSEVLFKMTILVSSLCESMNCVCEAETGTLLGAMKMSNILPWDIDSDFTFLSKHHPKFKLWTDKVNKAGFSLLFMSKPKLTKASNWTTLDSGEIQIRGNGYFTEIWGRWILNSVKYLKSGRNQTKVALRNEWIVSPPNPGNYVRNRFGYGIYQHVPHWRHMGYKHSYIPYKPSGGFNKCSKSGHHNCLDQFRTDGNLQFQGPIP